MRCFVLLLALLSVGPAWAADPTQRQWRENREGRVAFEEGDFESAREHFARRIEMAPGDPRAHFNLGNTLARLGRHEEAEAAWNEAARLAGSDALARDARYNQGVHALEQGAHDVAIRRLAEALALDPDDGEARRNLELALRRMQQPPQQQQEEQQKNQEQEQSPEDSPQESSEGQQDQPRQDGDREQQEGEQGSEAPPESAPEREGESENEQGQQDSSPQDQQDSPRPGEPPREQEGQGEGATGADEEAREQARRLLEQLAENEKDALERDLKRRLDAESQTKKGGKKW